MCFLAASRQTAVPLSNQLLSLATGLGNRVQTGTEKTSDLSLVLGLSLSYSIS